MTATEHDQLARSLDDLAAEVRRALGDADRRYIRRVIITQRILELGGRAVIFASLPLAAIGWFWPTIVIGTLSLALAKIVENMELGHNIMHGQWDWLGDRRIHSATWEWDTACASELWKQSHNIVHHAWANVVGRDRDLGYDILRVNAVQPWRFGFAFQPLYGIVLALLFEWGVAFYGIDFDAAKRGDLSGRGLSGQFALFRRKALRQLVKDYVLWPALAGPWFAPVLLANLAANVIRNVWGFAVIFCGHFPDGVEVFTPGAIAGESRGQWYERQIRGACNINGGRLFRITSGHLGHQIEHHLFPDLPSRRYPEIAPRVRALCERYDIPYNTGSLVRQFGTTVRTIVRLAVTHRTRSCAS